MRYSPPVVLMERERVSVCVCVHVFEDVGIREFSGHTGLESW